jgi:hypothetical protein
MASTQSYSDVPPAALAANWPPEILQEYLAGLQRDKERGIDDDDDDEAMLSDSDESDVEYDTSMTSDVTEYHPSLHLPEDIASDDSAFSSDDEFADDKLRATMHMRRALVLGRPTPGLASMPQKDLMDMVEGYLKELDDADVELAEVTGGPVQSTQRRQNALEYRAPEPLPESALEQEKALRARSRKEWCDLDKKRVMEELQLLAQALFRKERLIKRVREGKA